MTSKYLAQPKGLIKGTPEYTTWRREYDRAYRAANREEIRNDNYNAYHFGPKGRVKSPLTTEERTRRTNLWHQYKITPTEYDAMFIAQNGLCAVCDKPEKILGRGRKGVKRLAVDHNHDTGQIRSLLCHSCNTLIGHALEDAAILQAAIDYLRKWYH